MPSETAQRVLSEVFPNGISPEHLQIAMRIAEAVDRVTGPLARKALSNPKNSQRERYLEKLREGTTYGELAQLFDVAPQAVATYVKRLEQSGAKFERTTVQNAPGQPGKPATWLKMVKEPQR